MNIETILNNAVPKTAFSHALHGTVYKLEQLKAANSTLPIFQFSVVLLHEKHNADVDRLFIGPLGLNVVGKTLTVAKLVNVMIKHNLSYSNNQAIARLLKMYNETNFLVDFKKFIKQSDFHNACGLLARNNINFAYVAKNGDIELQGMKNPMLENTLKNISDLFSVAGLCPRQNAETLAAFIAFLRDFNKPWFVEITNDPETIQAAYDEDEISSCMQYNIAPSEVLGTPFYKNWHGVSLLIIRNEHDLIEARAWTRNGRVNSIYKAGQIPGLNLFLRDNGFECNKVQMLDGTLLPLVTTRQNEVIMPYIDGDARNVYLCETPKGRHRYLRIGGASKNGTPKKGICIGRSEGQNGYLLLNPKGSELGFKQGTDKREMTTRLADDDYVCDGCGILLNDYSCHYIESTGEVVCEDCYTATLPRIECSECGTEYPLDPDGLCDEISSFEIITDFSDNEREDVDDCCDDCRSKKFTLLDFGSDSVYIRNSDALDIMAKELFTKNVADFITRQMRDPRIESLVKSMQ